MLAYGAVPDWTPGPQRAGSLTRGAGSLVLRKPEPYSRFGGAGRTMIGMTTTPARTTPPRKFSINAITGVCALIVLVCLIIASVALAFAGWDKEGILALCGGILALAAPLLAIIERSTDDSRELGEQTTTLQVIAGRVNGELDERLQRAAEAAAEAVLARFAAGAARPVDEPARATVEVPPVLVATESAMGRKDE